MLTGTDENALKNVQAAEQLGLTPQKFCNRNADAFRWLAGKLLISEDNFIRTSTKAHHLGASRFWKRCRKEDIFLNRYKGLYCTGCEGFYEEEELQKSLCPTHHTKPEVVKETNYFFRLSAYQRQIEDLISRGRLQIFPETRKNEALEFVRRGLKDVSISRPSERSGGWGIAVPGDPSQVLYVWFDALTNYVTGLGFGQKNGQFERFWNDQSRKIHAIGKDILRFHAILWPAMLLSAGLPLPDRLVVHGFLTIDGKKISKSLENAVDPIPIIEAYGQTHSAISCCVPFQVVQMATSPCVGSGTSTRPIWRTALATWSDASKRYVRGQASKSHPTRGQGCHQVSRTLPTDFSSTDRWKSSKRLSRNSTDNGTCPSLGPS